MSPLNKDLSDFFGKYFIAVLSVNLYLYSSASIYLRGGSLRTVIARSEIPRSAGKQSAVPRTAEENRDCFAPLAMTLCTA